MTLPNFTLAPSSAAESRGEALSSTGAFSVDFGDKNAPDSAKAGGVNGIATEVIKGILIAVLAKMVLDAFR